MKKKSSKLRKKTIKVKICPICGSADIILWMGGELGFQYKCKKCDYIGPITLEKEIEN